MQSKHSLVRTIRVLAAITQVAAQLVPINRRRISINQISHSTSFSICLPMNTSFEILTMQTRWCGRRKVGKLGKMHFNVNFTGLRYGDWNSGINEDGSRVKHLSFPTPAALLQNQSYYLHAFFVKSGKSHIPRQSNYAGSEVSCFLS